MSILLSLWQLPYPISANRYWRKTNTGKVYKSTEAVNYKKAAIATAMESQIKPSAWLPYCDIELCIVVYPKQNKDGKQSKRVLDLDNCLKVAIDTLQGLAYVDDKQVVKICAEYGAAKVGGGMLVKVMEKVGNV